VAQGGGGDPFHLLTHPVGSPQRDAHCKDSYNWLGTNRGKCNSGKIWGIGGDPVSTTGASALLIASAPVLIGLNNLLKTLGIGKSSDSEFTTPAQQTVSQSGASAPTSDLMKYALPLAIGGVALLLFLKK